MLTGNIGRPKRLEYKGPHRFVLTLFTNRRGHLFISRERVNVVLEQFERAAVEEEFAIVAYCFLPDRVELLLEGRADRSDCRRFVGRAKQYSGSHYSKAFGHRVWQRYGFDLIRKSEEAALEGARKILENPVRAGVARRPGDYPYMGSMTHTVADILA